jgi:hypothetical protein
MNISIWSLLILTISTLNNTSIGSNSTSNEWPLANTNIETLFLSVGGWSFLIIGISALISKAISDRMSIKWTAEESKKLEILRAEANERLEKYRTDINHENSVFHKILESYSSEFKYTQSNRVKAIEILWEKTLEVRKLGTVPDTFYGIILEQEFTSVFNNDKVMKLIEPLSDYETNKRINSIIKDVEIYRPFLGEYLWTLFRTYTRLIGRAVFVLDKGRDERNIIMWYKDEFMRSILDEVFSENEKIAIYSMVSNSFTEATETLERKILYEISKTVFGELASKNNLEKAYQIQQLLNKSDLKESNT